jgi:hypothetical protein
MKFNEHYISISDVKLSPGGDKATVLTLRLEHSNLSRPLPVPEGEALLDLWKVCPDHEADAKHATKITLTREHALTEYVFTSPANQQDLEFPEQIILRATVKGNPTIKAAKGVQTLDWKIEVEEMTADEFAWVRGHASAMLTTNHIPEADEGGKTAVQNLRGMVQRGELELHGPSSDPTDPIRRTPRPPEVPTEGSPAPI